MFCPRSLSGSQKLPVLGCSFLLLIVALPSFAADKVRVAFSASRRPKGCCGLRTSEGFNNGISAEIVYTRAAIETLVAGEVDFGQMARLPHVLRQAARLNTVMIAGVTSSTTGWWRVPISNPWKISGENGSAFSAGAAPGVCVDLRAAALRLERAGRHTAPGRRWSGTTDGDIRRFHRRLSRLPTIWKRCAPA